MKWIKAKAFRITKGEKTFEDIYSIALKDSPNTIQNIVVYSDGKQIKTGFFPKEIELEVGV